jgi:hypothetical protein
MEFGICSIWVWLSDELGGFVYWMIPGGLTEQRLPKAMEENSAAVFHDFCTPIEQHTRGGI